ncbi:MAG: phospholipase D-like domain-containing protein [Elusimicrobiaceae bacterium]
MLKLFHLISFAAVFCLAGFGADNFSALAGLRNSVASFDDEIPAVRTGGTDESRAPVFRGQIPRVAFSDTNRISDYIAALINGSKTSVDVAIYGLSLPAVAEALVNAKNRGVVVRVIMNQSHVFPKTSPEIQRLIDCGVNMRILRGTGKWGIMHNKIGIFDGKTLVMGSFNWANTADTANFENAIFNTDPGIIQGYQAYFDWMWALTKHISSGADTSEIPYGSYGRPPSDPTTPYYFNGVSFPRYVFSPVGGTEAAIISAVNASQKTISVCMYSFFSQNVADALLAAKNRGVSVFIVMDKLQAGSSALTGFFASNGFNVRLSKGYAGKGVMHNKFAIFDNALMLTGSFNWSGSAENNNLENIMFSPFASDINAYAVEFNKIYKQGYAPKAIELKPATRMALDGGNPEAFIEDEEADS